MTLDIEFLDHMADYFGSFSLDELAERLSVSSEELLEELEGLIERNLDVIMEEMDYGQPEETEEEEA